MKKANIEISPTVLLLAVGLLLAFDARTLCAVLLPVFVHEAGHIIILRLYGLKPRHLKADLCGLDIEYVGGSLSAQFFSALAGPAMGLLYAFTAAFLSHRLHNELIGISAGVSLLFSLFNLLPALPLDGGRMLEALLMGRMSVDRCDRIMRCIGIGCGILVLAAALWLYMKGYGAALLVAGVKITGDNIFSDLRV